MASKRSSKSSIGKVTKKNYYDEWRPPSGVRYQLSQTNINIDAVVPKVKLEYTTVEYEPGQDLTVPEIDVPAKYAKQRGRGPVFVFQEEIDEAKRRKRQQQIIQEVMESCNRKKKQLRRAIQAEHDNLVYQIGPVWFHELSPKQMQSADRLKDAMLKDVKRGTIINTQETLGDMGVVYWPNHTKIEYAMNKFYLCPVEFLLTIFNLNRPKEEGKEKEYTLNDRIILSCVVHLSMRETLRELHLRIPSPPRDPDEDSTPVWRPHKKERKNKWKNVKWHKGMSPYLEPMIPVEQVHREGVYKNRHKEYASLDYFDYVEDMYNIFYEDDPESIKKRRQLRKMKRTKWNKPPKIPVRYIESKMKKKQVCQLKKPCPYSSPCKKLKSIKPPPPEPEPEPVEEKQENICCCSPQNFNEDTAFDLKIKITTTKDEYHLTQKLCPYSEGNAIGELNLVHQKRIENDEDRCCDEEGEGEKKDERKPFKKIEYTCECCTCGKSVNIFPGENSETIGIRDISNLKQIVNWPGLDTIPEGNEDDVQMYEEVEMEYEADTISDICKCKTPQGSTPSLDIDDPYYLCTCKSDSDTCTCCICDQMDKNFLMRIKRYNQAFNTHHQACACACKCKKNKNKNTKPTCCNALEPPCKYCFCEKKKEEEIGEVEEEEGELSMKKAPSSKDEAQTGDGDKPKRKSTEFQEPVEPEEPRDCACERLYNKYLNAHDSCMSLFNNYQKKIEEDVAEYLQDIQNRCLCGDTVSTASEEGFNEEDFDFFENLKAEDTSDSECVCQKNKKDSCQCCNNDIDDFYGGCTCNQTGVSLLGCTCQTTSSSNDPTSSSESLKCCCACNCGQGPCRCEEFLLKVKEEKARLQAERDEAEEKARKSTLKEVDDLSEEECEEEEEPDPRIVVLERFPTDRRQQRALLRMALAALAEDGYPLAKLPDVHRLPHFQVWLNLRSRAYVSMADRDDLFKQSKSYWSHIEQCHRRVDLPQTPMSKEKIRHITWGGVGTYKYMITDSKTNYYRQLKRAFIDKAQELFPSMFHYDLPNKTFREVYFSYLPSDENHIFVDKPWQLNEVKSAAKRRR